MNCKTSDFILPSVTDGKGWHPISSISLQQSLWAWQITSQKHPLLPQGGDLKKIQHPG